MAVFLWAAQDWQNLFFKIARIASVEGDARGVFSNEAAAEYSKAVGREVRVEEIQPVANELLAANLIMRRGHGLYGVTDPFVQ